MTNAQVLAGIIEDAGYVATIEENGVAFKVEGVPYRFESYADDDRYGRLMVGFNIPDDVSLERLHSIANEQNRKLKAVKTVVYGEPANGHVSFSIEMSSTMLSCGNPSSSGRWPLSVKPPMTTTGTVRQHRP